MKRTFLMENNRANILSRLAKNTITLFFIFLLFSTVCGKAQENLSSVNSGSKVKAQVDSLSSNSVYQPVLASSNTKIFNWAINYNTFNRAYLSSLAANYSLFVPTDEYFTDYIDPVAYAKDVQGALKFWYNTQTALVNATVYKYDKQTGVIGDSIGVITSRDFIANRLLDLLKSHIVVGDIQSGKSYYTTKGNTPLKVSGTENSMTVQGGGNIAKGTHSNVLNVYNQANGKTYFIDKPLQPSLKSVYKVLSETPEFSSFFALLNGFPATSSSVIFVSKVKNFGIDFNIKFLNTFNYTVYVPTNAAIDQAIQSGVINPWTSQGTIVGINDMTDATAKAAAILKLERFIRYHFQDNSVFVDSQPFSGVYRSATIKNNNASTGLGTAINKFYKIAVSANEAGLTLTSETGNTAHVVTTNGLYNITTRDYIFNYNPASVKDIDGTGTGNDFSLSLISTASTAVIHQIDNVLTFE